MEGRLRPAVVQELVRLCVLERGKEWHPGEFPESFLAAFNEIQIHPGGKNTKGNPSKS